MATVLEIPVYLVLVAFFVGMMAVGYMGLLEILVFPHSIHVELLAMCHGLKATWERGYRDVICYFVSWLESSLGKRG